MTLLTGQNMLLRSLRPSSLSPASSFLRQQLRKYSSEGDTPAARIWQIIRGKAKQDGEADAANAASHSKNTDLVPSEPELHYREVFAVPLTRKPLFPGTLMPVQVQDPRLIREILDLKRDGAQAHVGAFLQREAASSNDSQSTTSDNEQEPEAGSSAAAGSASGETSDQVSSDVRAESLYEIGTFAQVHMITPGPSGAMMLLIGHRRLKRLRTVSTSPLKVEVEHLRRKDFERRDDNLRATVMEIVSTLKELLVMHPLYNEQLKSFANIGGDFHNPDRLADMAASLTSADEDALQAILEELSVPERASAVLLLLKKEVELCKLQADIGKRVEEKISKDQRRYFLMEQLRSIKRELGMEKDDKSAVVQKYQERLDPIRDKLPEEAKKVIDDELSKLAGLEQASAEFNVTRNYLDWLTSLPWGKFSDERLDLDLAKQVLDEDHYGLDDVKERILEFIAVGKLRGSTTGKILCLVGPPGVGKTSVGRSIARALDRKYYRFSVGGLSDVAEIKGHRRTYVGAMPGKMAQCLKTTGTSNPLVLIDEIDKLSRGYQGDPASALLELLDPEQNKSFLDHYLDVPIDLSNVLFMCTANVLDTIPGPLLDRMEVLRISGYIADEKVHIARKYLEPQTRQEAGIADGSSSLTDTALNTLITEYCREAGVRNLKKHLEKIYRKVALKLVQRSGKQPTEAPAASTSADGSLEMTTASGHAEVTAPEEGTGTFTDTEGPITVEDCDLNDYVGQPPFTSDRIYEVTPPGVVMGLAWSAQGGNSLYIEAASVERGEGKGSLKTTGQLGDVMKESATIAHTFARSFLLNHVDGTSPPASGAYSEAQRRYFAENAIHVHVPAGATPKDGPSAGCAIITALLSLALDKPVRPDLAMTGEVTLTGRVLPIGGVKEKTLAARRSGIKTLIFPGANKKDFDELSDDVKEGITAYFVDQYKEVFDLALQYDPSNVTAHRPASETALQS